MIEKIIIAALGVLFIHATTWEGMLFSFIGRYTMSLPLFFRKPLYLCMICMTSIWGTILYFQPFEFISYLFAVGGVMVIISKFLPEDGVESNI